MTDAKAVFFASLENTEVKVSYTGNERLHKSICSKETPVSYSI
jgi:hypothetical protein